MSEILNQQLDSMKISNDDLKFENKEFSIMSIPPSDLSNIDYNDPSYLNHILSKLNIHSVSSDNFLESIALYSDIKNYPKCNNMETEIIGFNNQYVYEMTFLTFTDEGDEYPKNDIGTLLNIEGKNIVGTCLIFKSYISDTDYSMKLENISVNDIGDLLESRKSPKMVLYDMGDWVDEKVANLENYKKTFFGDSHIKETTLDYMNYSLKILYSISEYGEKAIPEIVDSKIENMIIYSIYGNMVDNFSLDELKKIRYLLDKKIVKVDNELTEKETDEMGRSIINTKYRLLNLMYRKYLE